MHRRLPLTLLIAACAGAPEPSDDSKGHDTDDSAATDDSDDSSPEPLCETVTFTGLDGSRTDLTAAFTDGRPLLLDQDGTVEVCPGTWFAYLSVRAAVSLRGLGTRATDTVLSGGESHTVLTVEGSGASAHLQRLTLDRGSARGAYGAADW